MANQDAAKFDGMTTNERLFDASQLAQFDDAVARRDLKDVRRLLEAVHVDERSIDGILQNVARPRA